MEKKKHTKILLLIFTVFYCATSSQAQQLHLPLNREHRLNYEKNLYHTDKKHPFHTAIKPYRASEVYELVLPDTTYGLKKLNAYTGFKKVINTIGYEDWVRFDENGFISSTKEEITDGDTVISHQYIQGNEKRKFYIAANPILHFEIGRGNNSTKTSYNARGIEVMANIGTKVSVYSAFVENQAVFPDYVNVSVRKNRAAPGEGKVRNFKDKGYDFSRAMGYINYTPNKYFSLELGHGKHFIGDGYRSLLLSDNSFVYPYIKFETTFWKFKYINIYSQLINEVNSGTDFTLGLPRKAATFNYLSLAATPWLSLGVFEGIIWNTTEVDGKRKFDANIINPIIGIRALQKDLDANKIYGFNASFNLPKHIVLYGQIMLQDFSTDIRSIKNRNGLQAGAKYYDAFGVKNLNFLVEYNIVRPYSYQGKDTITHYSHYNQALAHPMGAGFDEFIFLANYRYKRLVAELKVNFGRSSIDGPGLNVGTDIMLSLNEADFYDKTEIGQGLLPYKFVNTEMRIGYILNPKINMMIEAQLNLRKYQTDIQLPNDINSKIISLGLNTRIFNYYYDLPINF
ncbi:MAG: hypothetical protein M9887_03550 [Chitinophagales bacterium]|nr:hypothetical protein [Chitinophagales bacterium]